MAGEKRFGSSLFGYKKQDVYNFIDQLANDMEEQIKIKDDELLKLREENKHLKKQIEHLTSQIEEVENRRTYIADAIIKAEQQAKKIVEDAIADAEIERQEFQEQIDMEKQKLIQIKDELHQMRLQAIETIRKYEMELVELVEGNNDIQEAEQEVAVGEEEPYF